MLWTSAFPRTALRSGCGWWSGLGRFYCTVCNKQVLGHQAEGTGVYGVEGLSRYGCRTFLWEGFEWGAAVRCHLGTQVGWGEHGVDLEVIFKGQQGGSLSFAGRFRENPQRIAPAGMGD